MARRSGSSVQSASRRRQLQRWMAWLAVLGAIALGICGIDLTQRLHQAAQQPRDAIFVLGGSIRREIYATELARQYPKLPILISNGSPNPCIAALFERSHASIEGVWLESCARSTFENFVYGVPILSRWDVRHIGLVTSKTHLPRALWMARIAFGAKGIWVDLDVAEETGVPGNREYAWKTALDVTRTFAWAATGEWYAPVCNAVVPLKAVDLEAWCQQGFRCEHQAGLGSFCGSRSRDSASP